MSEDLESRLRAALRPVAPGEAFTRHLVARVAADRSRKYFGPAWWLAAGVAASLLLAVGVEHQLQEKRERESGLEARRQVIEALRVTSQKLHLAYETIESQSSSLVDETPGV